MNEMKRHVKIGVVNLMPKAEVYQGELLRALACDSNDLEFVMIRLRDHRYNSSDDKTVDRYRYFDEVLANEQLDGLILSGAPVEDLPFSEVRYWDELTRNLDIAVTAIPAILGLCWGGQVLAYRLGVDKIVFPQKKFGVYDLKNLDTANPSMKHLPAHFPCPLSSHAGYEDRVLEEAQDRGLMRLLAHAPETGYLVMESWDRQFAIHLGHPEYRAGRLGAEYERDVAAGREDVAAPENYCVEAPEANWKESGNAYFQNWIDAVIARKNP